MSHTIRLALLTVCYIRCTCYEGSLDQVRVCHQGGRVESNKDERPATDTILGSML